MGNLIFKIFIGTLIINIVSLFIAGVYHERTTTDFSLIENANEQMQYYSELYMNEDYADNSQTSNQEQEITATNSLIYSKGFWGTLMDGFKTIQLSREQYTQEDPITRIIVEIVNIIRQLLIAMNGVLLFLMVKNKFTG